MSHHATDSTEEPDDPFSSLSPDDVTALFDQGTIDLNNLLGCYDSPSYTPSSTDSPQFFDDFNIDSPFSPAITPADSPPTEYSSPDLSDPAYDSQPHTPFLPSTYPSTPVPATPHPYPLQFQQPPAFSLLPPRPYQTTNSRSRPLNGHYTSSVLGSSSTSRVNPPSHRRSLSQSDAERITATLHQPNTPAPPFRRTISVTPDDGPRGIPHLAPFHKGLKHHGQGHKKRRSNPPTSAPSPMVLAGQNQNQNPGFSRPYVTIGTPFRGPAPPKAVPYVGPGIREGRTGNGMRVQLNGPVLGYMPHEEQMGKGARVLEIGAMAVVARNAGKRPRGIDETGTGDHNEKTQGETDVLKLVGQMESQLKLREVGDTAKGLRGCEMIREALGDKECGAGNGEEGEGGEMQTDSAGEVQEDADVKYRPANIADMDDEVPKADTETFISSDSQDLAALLQNDLKAHGYGEHEV